MAKDDAKWAYWTKQINDWRASGLTRNAYCQREGLKPTTLDYWRPLIFPDWSFSNKGTQTLIGNLVSAGTAGDLSRFTDPKSNALLADQNWELRNAKKVGPINRLREMLWDFTYLCWKMTKGKAARKKKRAHRAR